MNFNKSKVHPEPTHPLLGLPREDLDLITQLVLHSGSLKDLATSYDVSYPTIRARLDRVIERLRDAVAGKARDPLTELLANLVERGELSLPNARTVRETAHELFNARAHAEGRDPAPGRPSANEQGEQP